MTPDEIPARRGDVEVATAEIEREMLRMSCPCGARAAVGIGVDFMPFTTWWLGEHSRCALDMKLLQRTVNRHNARKRGNKRGETPRPYRCGNCDGEGHNARTCPKVIDTTGDKPAQASLSL